MNGRFRRMSDYKVLPFLWRRLWFNHLDSWHQTLLFYLLVLFLHNFFQLLHKRKERGCQYWLWNEISIHDRVHRWLWCATYVIEIVILQLLFQMQMNTTNRCLDTLLNAGSALVSHLLQSYLIIRYCIYNHKMFLHKKLLLAAYINWPWTWYIWKYSCLQ